jgi:deoxyadenosine/deoxycytidine kinase
MASAILCALGLNVAVAVVAVVVLTRVRLLSRPSPRPRQVSLPRVVCVEGILGAGKSTLLRAVKELGGDAVLVVPECVDLWRALPGHSTQEPLDAPAPTPTPTTFNILELYYADPVHGALPFQVLVLLTRARALRSALKEAAASAGAIKFVFVERSSGGDACFAHVSAQRGLMPPPWLAVYEFARAELDALLPRVDAHVHLDLCVNAATERVEQRSRPEERGVTVEYQRMVEAGLARWLSNRARDVPVLTLNAKEQPERLAAKVHAWLNRAFL